MKTKRGTKIPKSVWVKVDGTFLPSVYRARMRGCVRYVPVPVLPPATEAEVARLTRRLMRKFDGRHHRFLVDYGWEHVVRFVLGMRS
jgi:hypothetical protein